MYNFTDKTIFHKINKENLLKSFFFRYLKKIQKQKITFYLVKKKMKSSNKLKSCQFNLMYEFILYIFFWYNKYSDKY